MIKVNDWLLNSILFYEGLFMETKIYRIKGKFVMGDEVQKFTKELKAFKEADIYEKIYSIFGSKHGINKNQIKIEDITEIKADEVVDPILKAIL